MNTHADYVILHLTLMASCPTAFHLGSKEVCAPRVGRVTTSVVVPRTKFKCLSEKLISFCGLLASSNSEIRESIRFLVTDHFLPLRNFYNLDGLVIKRWTFMRNRVNAGVMY